MIRKNIFLVLGAAWKWNQQDLSGSVCPVYGCVHVSHITIVMSSQCKIFYHDKIFRYFARLFIVLYPSFLFEVETEGNSFNEDCDGVDPGNV